MANRDGDARSSRLLSRQSLIIGGSALAAMVVVAGVLVWQFVLTPCGGWFSGLTATETGECVGLLHSNPFDAGVDPELHALYDQFSQANADVVQKNEKFGTDYVKIILLTPLSIPMDGTAVDIPKAADAAIPKTQIIASLQGAFTAMSRANTSVAFGTPTAPQIQVLLANQGSQQTFDDVGLAQAIDDENADGHPVLAVVGLGSSFPGTGTTALFFSGRSMPMVSAIASADDLNLCSARTLRSVSPSNTDYAGALREFLLQQSTTQQKTFDHTTTDDCRPVEDPRPIPADVVNAPDAQAVLRSGIVVADNNNDMYTRSLRVAFHSQLRPFLQAPDQLFTGSTTAHRATAKEFASVAQGMCNAPGLDTIFYAGRVTDFSAFVDALAERTCLQKQPLAVLVGATGFDSARDYETRIENANLTVIYATSADPTAWTKSDPALPSPPGAPPGFEAFNAQFHTFFPNGSLDDGYAIMYHDAVASAATAIRSAAQGHPVRRLDDVNIQLNNLSLVSPVKGASGTLGFSSTTGRAVGKLIPLRQIGKPTGAVRPGWTTSRVALPDHRCVYVVGGSCVPS